MTTTCHGRASETPTPLLGFNGQDNKNGSHTQKQLEKKKESLKKKHKLCQKRCTRDPSTHAVSNRNYSKHKKNSNYVRYKTHIEGERKLKREQIKE